MNRIDQLFEQKNRGILSVYYPAGYPSLHDTLPIMRELQAQGADLIELGIPFSDPMADGEVIQQAATQALQNGVSLKVIFEQLEQVRTTEQITIPLILMGYLNPIMHYGFERFCADCQRVGIDGVIIPDLPFNEYMADYKKTADRYGIKVTMFISPESSPERIRLIDQHTSGFIYMVSTAGTTGSRSSFDEKTTAYFERIEAMQLSSPRLIGFGISNRETFQAASLHSCGGIIGSKFVQLLRSCPTIPSAVQELISSIK